MDALLILIVALAAVGAVLAVILAIMALIVVAGVAFALLNLLVYSPLSDLIRFLRMSQRERNFHHTGKYQNWIDNDVIKLELLNQWLAGNISREILLDRGRSMLHLKVWVKGNKMTVLEGRYYEAGIFPGQPDKVTVVDPLWALQRIAVDIDEHRGSFCYNNPVGFGKAYNEQKLRGIDNMSPDRYAAIELFDQVKAINNLKNSLKG